MQNRPRNRLRGSRSRENNSTPPKSSIEVSEKKSDSSIIDHSLVTLAAGTDRIKILIFQDFPAENKGCLGVWH